MRCSKKILTTAALRNTYSRIEVLHDWKTEEFDIAVNANNQNEISVIIGTEIFMK